LSAPVLCSHENEPFRFDSCDRIVERRLKRVCGTSAALPRQILPARSHHHNRGHEQFQTQNTNSTIVGARNAKQVEGNVDAATLRLTTKEITEIEGKNEREPVLITAA
jgi:hypothetical protein